ncbi:MAG TPA: hypothetical protein DIS78_06535 [Lachnospiraceae bacterium]|nr:hypothetical protein [Lachnospiraceae bacterium]
MMKEYSLIIWKNISADKEGQTFRFYEFHSGEELISSVNDGMRIDLLILDMELGDMITVWLDQPDR